MEANLSRGLAEKGRRLDCSVIRFLRSQHIYQPEDHAGVRCTGEPSGPEHERRTLASLCTYGICHLSSLVPAQPY